MNIREINMVGIYDGPDWDSSTNTGFIPYTTHYEGNKVVSKGWGNEHWLANDKDYCVKILHFETGKRFSYHFHILKKEMWVVISGVYLLTVGDKDGNRTTWSLEPGSVYHVERGKPHQIECRESGDIFEVSTQHFNDDSYRIEKGD